jgi:hypothetical protein
VGNVRLTIDTGDSIEQVLAAVGALYKVELVVQSGTAAPATVSAPSTPEPAAAPKPRKRAAATTRSPRKSAASAPVDSAVIRAWARDNSVAVSPRGRFPAWVQQAYAAAQA